jgi:hypothetical protein
VVHLIFSRYAVAGSIHVVKLTGTCTPAGSDHRRETSGRLRHLRQIGPTPQVGAPREPQKPWDIVGRTETSIGRVGADGAGLAEVGRAARSRWRPALAKVLGVAAR